MLSFSSTYDVMSTDGQYDILAGDGTIGHMPRPNHCSEMDHDDVAVEPVPVTGPSCESAQPVKASPEPVCKLGHITEKSVQVQLLTCHAASQADVKQIMSSIAMQTEPQAVSSGGPRSRAST
ncbi:uncharacterized protein LOC119167534 isoform X3 [Rhipicephalus microplus]|uniref:uncharacterized protein LOC119167534 isoform X3 n=1 Tax=Rhipicephalus microplus TaxID=6941 RepID=UPI003F6D947E